MKATNQRETWKIYEDLIVEHFKALFPQSKYGTKVR